MRKSAREPPPRPNEQLQQRHRNIYDLEPRRRQWSLSGIIFFGGLVGSAALGQLFDRLAWAACVAGIGAALAVAAALARRLEISMASTRRP
jgi:hypothetical protein